MRVVKYLFAYPWEGKDNNCNTYVFANILKDKRHLVVDPGYITTPSLKEPALNVLLERMAADGLDPTAIGLVLLTHGHPDHCQAAEVFRQSSQALVAIHEQEAPLYQSRGGGAVDLYLGEGELVLGKKLKIKLNILHTPGHSPGHLAIYWPAEQALITGDLIFYHSTGRVDLPGGSAHQLVESINRVAGLDVKHMLCGHSYGHPGVLSGKQEVVENISFLKENVLP